MSTTSANSVSPQRFLRIAATVVATAHSGLILADIAVVASAAPNLYVNDPQANCGARFITNFMAWNLTASFLAIFASSFVALAFWMAAGFAEKRNPGKELLDNPWIIAIGIPSTLVISLCLFLVLGGAWNQVEFLRHPPPLPADFHNTRLCKNLWKR